MKVTNRLRLSDVGNNQERITANLRRMGFTALADRVDANCSSGDEAFVFVKAEVTAGTALSS